MTAKKIHPFRVEGNAVDVETVYRLRAWIENEIIAGMNNQGYLPVLDITPSLMVDYDQATTHFNYCVTVQGVYVGRKLARDNEGVYGGELIGHKSEICTGTDTCNIDGAEHKHGGGDT